jgi:hypothetical protein
MAGTNVHERVAPSSAIVNEMVVTGKSRAKPVLLSELLLSLHRRLFGATPAAGCIWMTYVPGFSLLNVIELERAVVGSLSKVKLWSF